MILVALCALVVATYPRVELALVAGHAALFLCSDESCQKQLHMSEIENFSPIAFQRPSW